MNSTEDRPSPHELVIVRRRTGGDSDGHHGGAWKIAFADFMTALMCFFLVMWLVNASDKQTITQIATYFNPIKLNDKFTSQKGLNDPDSKPAPRTAADKAKAKAAAVDENGAAKSGSGSGSRSMPGNDQLDGGLAADIELARDPQGVIDRIVSAERHLHQAGVAKAGATPGMPRDLFDIQSAPNEPRSANEKSMAQKSVSSLPNAGSMSPELSADAVRADIANALSHLGAPSKPRVEVADMGEEVLISIIDDSEPGMFSIGSSRPTAVLIQVMDGVARALDSKGGAIVVRGHTDSRPYNSGGFDNWRLSSARAQMAYHMLVRSGVPAERTKRIEGHADRLLKIATNPLASQNRRIELLVTKSRQ